MILKNGVEDLLYRAAFFLGIRLRVFRKDAKVKCYTPIVCILGRVIV